MSEKLIVLFLVCLLLLTSGCVFSNYRQVNDFDLDPEAVNGNGSVHVASVRNVSSSGLRIQSRSYFGLSRDPYNLWATEPGALVCNALNKALGKDGCISPIVLTCELEYFEADLPQRIFRLSGTYSSRTSPQKIRFDIKTPLRGPAVANIVLAASEAVRQLAVRMSFFGKN